MEGLSVLTGMPTLQIRDEINLHAAVVTDENTPVEFVRSINGTAFRFLALGWFARDEQLKAENAIEATPCGCAIDQTTLRAVGAKFCPQCGIIRVLHEENLSDVAIDGD